LENYSGCFTFEIPLPTNKLLSPVPPLLGPLPNFPYRKKIVGIVTKFQTPPPLSCYVINELTLIKLTNKIQPPKFLKL